MNTARKPFNRHASRLSVIPITFPVFDCLPHRAHPRLHIQYNLIAFPVSDEESEFEIICLLNIYLPEDETGNALETSVRKNLEEQTEPTNLNWRIDAMEEELSAARQKNDEFHAGQNEEFRALLENFASEQAATDSINPKEQMSPKDRRKFLQQKERIYMLRSKLDALLQPHSALLPHPLKKKDKPPECESESIEELEERLAKEKTAFEDAIQTLRRNKSIVIPMLNDYLLGILNCVPSTSTQQKLGRIFMHQRLIIGEIESGFGEGLYIPTNERGIPADANSIPFSVDLHALSIAYEERAEILYGGYYAFVPPDHDYADGMQYGLVGTLRKKHAELVAIPIRTIQTILSVEREYRTLIKHAIRVLYAPAPATGVKQEQEKPEDAKQFHLADNPSFGEGNSPRTPQESFPHFPFDEKE